MSTAFKPADILLPQHGISMEKWSVVACDQYTSEPDYWNETAEITKDAKSALNMILPEIYLEEEDVSDRISRIHDTMKSYLTDDTFREYKNSMIYTERIQSDGKVRAGIIGMIDLEEYDFNKGSTSSVRATEATVIERIPPRIKVREGAELELPHIMILIDDENKTVIEPVSQSKDDLEKLYDFKLMQGGGSVSGYLLDSEKCAAVNSALTALGSSEAFCKRYGMKDTPVLLYAMGDGNHSLATAKTFYENLKKSNPGKDLSNHPARYALVEIVNLHSDALQFEAIHRIVTGIDTNAFTSAIKSELALSGEKSAQSFTMVIGEKKEQFYVHNPSSNLTVGSVQNFIDKYLKENGGKVDYIHGTDVIEKLASKDNSIGLILPDMGKEELFPTVIKDGALPRKTFSMGHAADKRYYIECRKITE